jgi:hypothetical protein
MPLCKLLLIPLAVVGMLLPVTAGDVVDIGSRRELFVDHYLIDTLNGTRLELNRPRDEGLVVRFDNPWELNFCGYCTVIKDGETYRLYYRGLPKVNNDGPDDVVTCYAESKDGIHWKKPDLGLFEIQGTKQNNVILANDEPSTHNFSPFLDTRPNVPADERYKAIAGLKSSGLLAYVSPDGIHWKKVQSEPVLPSEAVSYNWKFDSQNVAFWSPTEQRYLCYFRVGKDNFRRIARAESDNFLQWSTPELMEYRRPQGEVPIVHHYTNQTHPYFRAPHISVATAARFMPGRQVISAQEAKTIGVDPGYFRDTSDAVFMTTRGGNVYDCTVLDSFIRAGIGIENWVSRTNYPALNVVQTGPTEMSLYTNQNYGQPTAHLRRYSMRLDGFISVRADYDGGEMQTRPFRFSGKRLTMNFATSAAGGVRVEIQDAEGNPLEGYSLEDAREQIGNEIERAVSWQGGGDLSSLSGRPIRLRFVMNDADLYAIRFAAD